MQAVESQKETIIVLGSSRSDGNSSKISQIIQEQMSADLIDLNQLSIHPYTYHHAHSDDDFLPTMRKLVDYQLILFVTPVYWYTMSGLMKSFFDRISDCLRVEKGLGRQLRGKSMAAICCGSESTPVPGFFTPFKMSADYLGMQYLGDVHLWVSESEVPSEVHEALLRFLPQISNQA